MNNPNHRSASERRIAELELAQKEYTILLNYLVTENGNEYRVFKDKLKLLHIQPIRTEVKTSLEGREYLSITRVDSHPNNGLVLPGGRAE